MEKLPDNVIRFDVAKVEYGKRKLCQCLSPHYEIDYQNKLVKCTDCDAIVDPFESLVSICRHYERIDNYRQQALEERKAIDNYKPWLLTIKDLESKYRGKKMLPTCPCCHEIIDLEELRWTTWSDIAFYKPEERQTK